MFTIKEEKTGYWVKNDKYINYFWPFKWIIAKNKNYWKVDKAMGIAEYKNYKFAIWFWNKKIFIFDENWLLKIINYELWS